MLDVEWPGNQSGHRGLVLAPELLVETGLVLDTLEGGMCATVGHLPRPTRSSTDDVAEVLRAFEAGADDVIRSPFVHAELLARVRALLRRSTLSSAGVIQFGALRIDTTAHRATFGSTPLHLRRLEYALLVHLARDPSRVYTKDELLRELWGFRAAGSTRTVDTHACRLRRSLAHAGAGGWLTAVRGVGYRLAPDGHGELRVLAGGRSA